MKRILTIGGVVAVAPILVITLLLVGLASDGDGSSTASPQPGTTGSPIVSPTQDPSRTRFLAPIDSAEAGPSKDPGHFVLTLVAGLPSGCAAADGYEISRTDTVINVQVFDTLPSAKDIVCTAIYGTYPLRLDLGTGFVAGREYHVDLNGTKQLAFTFVN